MVVGYYHFGNIHTFHCRSFFLFHWPIKLTLIWPYGSFQWILRRINLGVLKGYATWVLSLPFKWSPELSGICNSNTLLEPNVQKKSLHLLYNPIGSLVCFLYLHEWVIFMVISRQIYNRPMEWYDDYNCSRHFFSVLRWPWIGCSEGV